MDIVFDRKTDTFHLKGSGVSYVFSLLNGRWPVHGYWGRALDAYGGSAARVPVARASFSPNPSADEPMISMDDLPLEFPHGNGDFRPPAFACRFAEGGDVCDFTYRSHTVTPGKPGLDGLPMVYAEAAGEAMTLQLVLEDAASGLQATLLYTVFRDHAAICRSVRFANNGSSPVRIRKAASASVDFREAGFDLLTLWGGHANERNVQRRPLAHGAFEVASTRGASSHQFSPFAALCRPGAGEDFGDVYGFSLVYSGNFSARAFVDQFGYTRFSMGLDADGFEWLLQPGETLQTPEAVLVYAADGLGGMSRAFHRLFRTRLARGRYRDAPRPVLINNWEATYFDFDETKLLALARRAAGLGIELFVLDDGWFGRRDTDAGSLGDWTVDRRKLPGGLKRLAEQVGGLGMQFGIWMEPEMVSPDSDLYRAHPDWALAVPGRRPLTGRSQLVLDLGLPEVREYLVGAVCAVLESAPIRYVKWDMNRSLTDVYSKALPAQRQGEAAHRYVLGLYCILEEITARFPQVLFESCSGGGGRFDAGMLYYMPQTWASDNTDAVCRLRIQQGTTLVFPPVSMGSHVSVAPNHQVGRDTPLATRAAVAMAGCFGYELDITALGPDELDEMAAQVAKYKDLRETIQFGSHYRLLDAFAGNDAAWCFVSKDRRECVVTFVRVLAQPNAPVPVLRVKGLVPEGRYRDEDSGQVYGGDELMYAGLTFLPRQRDFDANMWVLRQV